MTDRLDDALGAFRGEHDRARGDAQATRRRLLRSVQRQETRRRLSIAASLVAALLASNSVTWAWSTGRLDEVLGGSSEGAELPPRAASPAVAARVPEPRSTGAAVVPTEPLAPESPLPTAAPRVVAARSERRSARAAALDDPATPADAPAPVATETHDESLSAALQELEPPPRTIDADRAAFAEAHRLHFGGGSPAAALSAWDRYLARFASGLFVPEARFNRAVILLRLRRDAEASDALRPFAQGAYDGLRMREARELLDALDRGTLRREP